MDFFGCYFYPSSPKVYLSIFILERYTFMIFAPNLGSKTAEIPWSRFDERVRPANHRTSPHAGVPPPFLRNLYSSPSLYYSFAIFFIGLLWAIRIRFSFPPSQSTQNCFPLQYQSVVLSPSVASRIAPSFEYDNEHIFPTLFSCPLRVHDDLRRLPASSSNGVPNFPGCWS